MVWIPLKNGSGQVVKDIVLQSPQGKVYKVESSRRQGINRYAITLIDQDDKSKLVVTNHDLMQKKSNANHEPWSIVGEFHSPEKIAQLFGRTRVDPDANKPRPQRHSFWQMQSRPGSHNYRQKVKLMRDPYYQKHFGKYFAVTLRDNNLNSVVSQG